MDFRRPANALETRQHAVSELRAKPLPLVFVPAVCGFDVFAAAGENRSSFATLDVLHTSHEIVPRKSRLGRRFKTFPPTVHLVDLPIADGDVGRNLGKLIPKVLDELEFLSNAQSREGRCFRTHHGAPDVFM